MYLKGSNKIKLTNFWYFKITGYWLKGLSFGMSFGSHIYFAVILPFSSLGKVAKTPPNLSCIFSQTLSNNVYTMSATAAAMECHGKLFNDYLIQQEAMLSINESTHIHNVQCCNGTATCKMSI